MNAGLILRKSVPTENRASTNSNAISSARNAIDRVFKRGERKLNICIVAISLGRRQRAGHAVCTTTSTHATINQPSHTVTVRNGCDVA